jgi:hypothetical protein
MRRIGRKGLLLVPVVLFAIAYVDRQQAGAATDWRSASREPIGLAPAPETHPDAIVQVYAARTVRWRGYFGVHTWVAVKRSDAPAYTVYEVNGWRLRRAGTAVAVGDRAPDSRWYGTAPRLLAEKRGTGVDAIIDRIEAAVQTYPFAGTYRVWPGPNSNTFVAHVLRAAPELELDLPATAIGKDFLGSDLVARTPSGTGGQVSLYGVVGVLAGLEEGIEINLLGATFGIDPLGLGLKLPLVGRLGMSECGGDCAHAP